MAALRASFRWPRALMWTPLLVLAVALGRGATAPDPGTVPVVLGPSVAPGQLAVVTVEGRVTRKTAAGAAETLRAEARVQAGDRIECDAGGRVVLADAKGNSVEVHPGSGVTLGSATAAPLRFHFNDPRGTLRLDLRAAGESELRSEAFGVHLSRAVIEVERDGDGAKLTLRAGGATAYTAGGALHRLAAGRTVALEAPHRSVLPGPERVR